MYKTNKSISIKLLSVFRGLLFLAVFTSPVYAEESYSNLPPDPNMMGMLSLQSIDLPFDPNDYSFLVYNPGGSAASIIDAMKIILGRDLNSNEIRDQYNEVTPNDLATHDILIVGWNEYDGDISGLHSDDLAAGITGRVILSGHDADYHTVNGITTEIKQAAQTFLVQAIDYVLQGGGKGMITLGCTAEPNAFPYLPSEWGVLGQRTYYGRETVTEFTTEGLESGVYDGLEPSDMSIWYESYHDVFDIDEPNSEFVTFERGGGSGDDIVTVARIAAWPCDNITFALNDNTNNCVEPYELQGIYLNYAVCFYTPCAINDVNIIDYLPEEVDFDYASHDGIYDANSHTVTWNLDDLAANDVDCFTIRVKVTDAASPNSYIINKAKMYSGQGLIKVATEITDVCCWGGEIIRVDASVECDPNDQNGATWGTAYGKLQDALAQASPCDEIWVAQGTYKPTLDAEERQAKFDMIDYVGIYGGFAGVENERQKRYWPVYQTILSGDPNGDDANGWGYREDNVNKVVSAENVSNAAVLDGFIIIGGYDGGIYIDNGSPTISHNLIKDNNCGVYIKGIESAPVIENNWIYKNKDYGITIENADSQTMINNNTVVYNEGAGIYRKAGAAVQISSCILWGQDANDLPGCTAWYSCIEDNSHLYDPNDPNSVNRHNICADPCLFDPNEDDYHIYSDSPCVDTGDPNFENNPGQKDIDDQYRKMGDYVDMGADEYCDQGSERASDINEDEIVNLQDYAQLADAWQSDPNDENWDETCDINNDGVIDLADLVQFADEWLWISCWKMADLPEESMMMGMGMDMDMGDSMKMVASVPETISPSQAQELLKELINWMESAYNEDEELQKQYSEEEWKGILEYLEEILDALCNDAADSDS